MDLNHGYPHGLAVQEDTSVDFWHHHMNRVPAQSRCTLGVSMLDNVGGLGQLFSFASRTRLIAFDINIVENVSHSLTSSEEMDKYATTRKVN